MTSQGSGEVECVRSVKNAWFLELHVDMYLGSELRGGARALRSWSIVDMGFVKVGIRNWVLLVSIVGKSLNEDASGDRNKTISYVANETVLGFLNGKWAFTSDTYNAFARLGIGVPASASVCSFSSILYDYSHDKIIRRNIAHWVWKTVVWRDTCLDESLG